MRGKWTTGQRALGQMASGVTRDINNALSPVTAYTELVLHPAQPRSR